MSKFRRAIEQDLLKHGFEQFCPKAVLFDMDGVIYDSMPNHARSWHQAMASVGIQMEESEAYRYEGMRGVETIKMKARQQWDKEISDEKAQKIYDLKVAAFNLCPPAPKMDGTEVLMKLIRRDRLPICVVTGSGQPTLLDKLVIDFRGLIYRDHIISSSDVAQGKPAPDPYLMALERIGVNPWEAVVIENAPLGVQAAVAAQCFTIAVNTGPLPDEELINQGADLLMPDMKTFSKQWRSFIRLFHLPKSHGSRWDDMYNQIMKYMEEKKRRPSKYYLEDRAMFNWIKYNKKRYARGLMAEKHIELFEKLLATAKLYQHVNQYE